MDFHALEDAVTGIFFIIIGIFALLLVGSLIATIVGLVGLIFSATWAGGLALEAGITFGMLLIVGGGFFAALCG